MDPFVGEIRIFSGNFAPKGWAVCDGQLLPISQNTALFSLLGTNYGGDGKSTFGLPNLQARFPLHQGSGPGLTPRSVGESDGSPAVTLTEAQMPAHSHTAQATASPTANSPDNNNLAPAAGGASIYRIPGTMAAMAAQSVSTEGSGQPHPNRQPFLVLTFIIALQGVFPPRS